MWTSYQPIVLEVHGVDGNIVCALLFCTTHPAAHYMTVVNRLPRVVDWKEHVWHPEARRLAENKRIVRKEGPGAKIQKGLFEY